MTPALTTGAPRAPGDPATVASPAPVPRAAWTLASLVLMALAAVPAGAQRPPDPSPGASEGAPAGESSLTITGAARRALEHHPSIPEARARARVMNADVGSSRSARLPRLSVSGSATQYQEPTLVTPIHGFTPGQTPPFDRTLLQGGGHLTYTLWDGGARGARIDASRSRASAARAGLSEAEQSLVSRVAASYLEILTLSRVLEAHDRRAQALEAELARVEDLRQVGRAARVDRLRVESALAGAEAERVAVASEMAVARADLARLIGTSRADVEPDRLTPPAPVAPAPPPADTLLARALDRNPAVERARREVEASEAGLSVARSARWPRLEMGGHLLHWGSDADPNGATEWNAGLQVSVPLFTGGATGSRIARAEAERRASRERLRLARLRADEEVDAALSALRDARARTRSLETLVRTSEEVVRIEALRLETGRGTQTDYLDAESALLDARAGLTRARHAALAARVRLARIQGVLTPDWLARNLGGDR